MSRIVDPSPWIATRLDELATEYVPMINEVEHRLEEATDRELRRRLRKERRLIKRQYRHARGEIQRMRMLPW